MIGELTSVSGDYSADLHGTHRLAPAAVVHCTRLAFMRTFDAAYLEPPASLFNHRPLSHMGRSGKGREDHKDS